MQPAKVQDVAQDCSLTKLHRRGTGRVTLSGCKFISASAAKMKSKVCTEPLDEMWSHAQIIPLMCSAITLPLRRTWHTAWWMVLPSTAVEPSTKRTEPARWRTGKRKLTNKQTKQNSSSNLSNVTKSWRTELTAAACKKSCSYLTPQLRVHITPCMNKNYFVFINLLWAV